MAFPAHGSRAASLPLPRPGYIFDPLDTTTTFQDTGGLTLGATGSPVLRLRDKSPNRLALSNSAGPTLRVDGLEFDGVNDALILGFTFNLPFTRVSAIRQKSWVNGNQIFGGGTNNAGTLLQSGVSPQIGIFDGTAVVGALSATLNTWFVVTEVHNGASSSIQLNNAAATTGNPGAVGPGGLSLGKRPSVETYANFDMGRVVGVNRVLSADELAALKTWVGAGSGVTV
jgi:hypothetical protein